jgi:uncharacterized membrane protein
MSGVPILLEIKNMIGKSVINDGKPFFIWLILFITLMSTQLVPPFQSPDEFDHIKRAYALSQGRVFMVTPEGQSTGTEIDSGLNAFMGIYNKLPFKYENKLSITDVTQADSIKWTNKEQFNAAPGVNYYFPLVYAPQALGLSIGKALDLSVSNSYYLARYLCIATIFVLIVYAHSLFPINALSFVLLLLPMTIFQMSSASMDGIAIALSLVALSCFMRILLNQKSEIRSNKFFYIMLISISMLVMCRFNLVLMFALPFYLAFKDKNRNQLLITSLFLFLAFLWIAHGMMTTVDKRVSLGMSTGSAIVSYVTHPADLLSVLFRTLSSEEKLVYYWDSLVGILGWLDHRIPDHGFLLISIIILLTLIFSVRFNELKSSFAVRALLVAISLGSVLLTFLILLVTWNGYPAKMIEGVQGRYFLIPLLVLSYAISPISLSLKRKAVLSILILGSAAISLAVMPKTLLNRYYISNLEFKISESPQETVSTGLCALDEPANNTIVRRSQELVMSGWAFDDSSAMVPEMVVIKLINASTGIVLEIPAARSTERPDVVKAFNRNGVIKSGFTSIKITGDFIPAGKYRVKILQMSGEKAISCPLVNELEFI